MLIMNHNNPSYVLLKAYDKVRPISQATDPMYEWGRELGIQGGSPPLWEGLLDTVSWGGLTFTDQVFYIIFLDKSLSIIRLLVFMSQMHYIYWEFRKWCYVIILVIVLYGVLIWLWQF
jgi:hypothetical protein